MKLEIYLNGEVFMAWLDLFKVSIDDVPCFQQQRSTVTRSNSRRFSVPQGVRSLLDSAERVLVTASHFTKLLPLRGLHRGCQVVDGRAVMPKGFYCSITIKSRIVRMFH